jgi:hypothetical protein
LQIEPADLNIETMAEEFDSEGTKRESAGAEMDLWVPEAN